MNRTILVLPLLAGVLSSLIYNHPALADTGAPAISTAAAPTATTTAAPAAATGTVSLGNIKVEGEKLNRARDTLNPETGTSTYHFDIQTIDALPEAYNTPLQDVILQAPGVAKDSFGQLHVRGDHADIQYRINGIILPEAISGFGDALGTRFIEKIDFLTGALPAQYGYRTAGIINITTNDGLEANGGSVDLFGGSRGTFSPSIEYGGNEGSLTYYVTGTFLRSDVGIESPTSASTPIHDATEQNRGFLYVSDILDPDTRVSAILGHSLGNFQIPDNPGQPTNFTLNGSSTFDSATLNETQRELNDYGILALQVTKDRLDYQLAVFTRYSSVNFSPDPVGDLLFNGVAAQVYRRNIADGVQADASYALNDAHTVRWGLFGESEHTTSDNNSAVFPADSDGNQTSDQPFSIVDDGTKNGGLYGLYLQDQWQVSQPLTVNYGLRYDVSNGYVNESQWSPRVDFLYALSDSTGVHGGFARYFTPPTLELIAPTDIALFQNTTNQLPSDVNTNVSAERDSYYDLGISHNITPSWQVGVDGYYKDAKNLLDEGQFGQALVFSNFNYAKGRVWGIELTSSYQAANFSTYYNLAYSRALATQVESGQYNFDPLELIYIQDHYVHLDHDQTWTASGGAAYSWSGTRYSLDGIFGSGLRRGFANTESLPSYLQLDASASHSFDNGLSLRFTIINLLDRIYEIRDGSGIGVGAPQFGPRRGFFVDASKSF